MNFKEFMKRLGKAFLLLFKDIFKGLRAIGKGIVKREREYLKKHPSKKQEPLFKFKVPESEFKNFGVGKEPKSEFDWFWGK